MEELPIQYLTRFLLVVGYAVVFWLAKWCKDLLTPYRLDHELTEKDNPAVAVSVGGYFMGVSVIFIGSTFGNSVGWWQDPLISFGYALAGTLLLNATRFVTDRLILPHFSNAQKIVEERNTSVGLVQASSYFATGLIIAGSLQGEAGGMVHAFVFFLAGQVLFVMFTRMYMALANYSVAQELANNNLAVAFSICGAMLSIGLICMKAVSGAFVGWLDSFTLLIMDMAIVSVYYVLVRFYFDKILIPGSPLRKELVEDKNVGAGVLEMLVAVGFAGLLVHLI